jgi:O-methyltransferase
MTAATLEHIAGAALSSVETLRATYDLARATIDRGVPGDFVECGVFAGAQCAAMALALMDCLRWPERVQSPRHPQARHIELRRVHLFDSFTGIPACSAEDKEWIAAGHKPGHSTCSMEQVQRYMRDWGIDESLLVYHPGMFRATMPLSVGSLYKPTALTQIALLRLDGDLYESTKTALEYLYPLVSPGGWVICDDFDLSGARKAVLDYVGGGFGPVYWQRQAYHMPKEGQ